MTYPTKFISPEVSDEADKTKHNANQNDPFPILLHAPNIVNFKETKIHAYI